jgi:hypothetical protein
MDGYIITKSQRAKHYDIPGVVLTLPKFMQTFNDSIYRELEKEAKRRGISVQELIRAVIVPEWAANNHGPKAREAPTARLNEWPIPFSTKPRPRSSSP